MRMWNICGKILSICSLMIPNTLLSNCLQWRDRSDKPGSVETRSPVKLCGGEAWWRALGAAKPTFCVSVDSFLTCPSLSHETSSFSIDMV